MRNISSISRPLVVAACVVAAFVAFKLAAPLATPVPQFDLTSADPLVADAIYQAQNVVIEQPATATAWGELALVAIAHGYNEQGEFCLVRACELDTNEGRWWYYRGHLADSTDMAQAVEYFRIAAQRMSSSALPRIRLARTLIRLNQLNEAQTELESAKGLDPTNPRIIFELGRLAAARDEMPKAKELLEAAAKMPGWYARPAYVELLQVCRRLSDLDCARHAAQNLARLPTAADNMNDWLLDELASRGALLMDDAKQADALVARGQWPQAVAIYQRLVDERPQLTSAKINLIFALGMAGQNAEAIAIGEDIVQDDPHNARAWMALALRYEQSSQNDKAIDAYRQCTKLMPGHAQSHFNLGARLEAQGDLEAALLAYIEATKADPGFAQAHLAAGVVLQKRDRLDEAITYFKNAAQLKPGDPILQRYLDKILKERANP